jgi:hypothetical protein
MLLLLAGLGLRLDYHHIISYAPQGVHQWRQADCASMALNYYQDGMAFFHPQIHALLAQEGQSSYAASELPLLPYLTALSYHLSGFSEGNFRTLNLLFFFTGLFYLFLLARSWIKDDFWSLMVPALLFTSPVLVYYAPNFLSDSAAFAMVFPGWYYAHRYFLEKNRRWNHLALAFFALAALLKISAGVSLVTYVLLLLFGLLSRKPKRVEAKMPLLLPVLLAFMVVVAWYAYALYFNASHQSHYFGTRILPLWSLDTVGRSTVWDGIAHTWYQEYFHHFMMLSLPLLLLFSLGYAFRRHALAGLGLLLLLMGNLIYFVLFYAAFRDHDYYLLNAFILPAFLFLMTLAGLREWMPRWMGAWWVKLLSVPLFIFFLNHAANKQKLRYHGWGSEKEHFGVVMENRAWMDEAGIPPEMPGISWPDYTSCYSLYMINRKGWTGFVLDANESVGVEKALQRGAGFLLHLNKETALPPWLEAIRGDTLDMRGNAVLYDIRKPGSKKTANFTHF